MDLKFRSIKINNQGAQYLQLNNEGVDAVFYSANGFPLGTYSEFLKHLTQKYKLSCLSPRACWPNIGDPPLQTNWETYADDLIAYVEQKFNEPIVVIGHSQGATVAIIAASKRPELFKSMIIIEPASVSAFLGCAVKFTPYFIKKHFQPFKSGLMKQDIWESRDAFYEHCRLNKAYKRIGDKVLKDFAEYGLRPIENGKFTLTFSSKWETSNYTLAPTIWKYLKKIKLPIQVIAGKPSLFFTNTVRENWRKVSPNSTLEINKEFGHLFPLEAPEDCASHVLNKA
jgi:pimeloyl-ACP methyl ester carboxylesterase